MTLKLILAFVIAFAVSAVVGFFLVPYLKRIKAGQSIKENGPTWHMSKQGTPTMGGIMFIAAIILCTVGFGWKSMTENHTYTHLYVLALALCYGLVGFADDFVNDGADVIVAANQAAAVMTILFRELVAKI